jgi:uncharacterized membrane protein
MGIKEKLRAYRIYITILLALTGIATMWYYSYCETSCSYLQGDIFGFDLQYIGIAYMLTIIILAAFRQMAYVRMLLASGIGVEIYLIFFQFKEDVYCSFCLAFAITVIMAFALNYEKPLVQEDGWLKRVIYGLGDVEYPLQGRIRLPILLFILVGYIFVILTFSGSATPAYGAEKSLVPSYGSGKYELIVFTDYFCQPCQALESEMDPMLNEILSGGGVRVTFVDLPTHKDKTPLYAKYFLYAVKAGRNYKDALHARRVLFSLAKNQTALSEDELKSALKAQGIAFTFYDLKPVYPELNKIIYKYKADRTPTCIVRYSDADVRKYTGAFEIQNGLGMLRASQINSKKK